MSDRADTKAIDETDAAAATINIGRRRGATNLLKRDTRPGRYTARFSRTIDRCEQHHGGDAL